MNVLKSLIGGVIGAAIATGIYFAIREWTGETYIWFPIVTGLFTGVFAHFLAGKSRGGVASYVCGALAGLIAGVAIFGVDFVPVLMAKNTDYGPVEIRQRESSESDSDAETADTTESDDPSEQPDDEGETDEGDADEGDTDEGDADEGDGSDNTNTDATGAEKNNFDANEEFKNRGVGPAGSAKPVDSDTQQRLTDLIKKQSHETWFDLWMPYVFSGIGVLIAYQLARGFGSGTPKSEKT